VDLNNVLIERSRKIRPAAGARVLAEGSDGPLMVVRDRGGRRMLSVAWAVLDSDFPLRVGFPVFVANAVSWLVHDQAAGGGMNAIAGRTFSVAAPAGARSLTLRTPAGDRRTLSTQTGAALVRGLSLREEVRLARAPEPGSGRRPRHLRRGERPRHPRAQGVRTRQARAAEVHEPG
jgi:hypothetical protein